MAKKRKDKDLVVERSAALGGETHHIGASRIYRDQDKSYDPHNPAGLVPGTRKGDGQRRVKGQVGVVEPGTGQG
ncbi:MAG: hypothetical protein Q7S50_04215 [bacterium]|nr:hypothetical protein [bacterium]